MSHVITKRDSRPGCFRGNDRAGHYPPLDKEATIAYTIQMTRR